MRLQYRLFALLAASSLIAVVSSTLAEDGAPPPAPHKEFCQDNPGKCEEARARRQEFCKTNPEKCEHMMDEAQHKMQDHMGTPPPGPPPAK